MAKFPGSGFGSWRSPIKLIRAGPDPHKLNRGLRIEYRPNHRVFIFLPSCRQFPGDGRGGDKEDCEARGRQQDADTGPEPQRRGKGTAQDQVCYRYLFYKMLIRVQNLSQEDKEQLKIRCVTGISSIRCWYGSRTSAKRTRNSSRSGVLPVSFL